VKIRTLLVLIASATLGNAATIDFDSAAYAIPSGQIAADANGVDGWEVSSGGTNSYLGFIVPSPGIGTDQALGFGPKWVEPEEASMSLKRAANYSLTGNTTGTHIDATATFTADILINQPNNSAGNDVFGISLYGDAGNETISFTFDPGNIVSGLAGELGVGGTFNAYYNSQYQFKVSFTGDNGDFQTYAASLIDANGGGFTKYGVLTSTEISSIGLTYALADSTAAMSTASDGYIVLDNVVYSATIPEPSTSLLSLIGVGLLILRRRR
jgi:hypothetical protein